MMNENEEQAEEEFEETEEDDLVFVSPKEIDWFAPSEISFW